jgi:hypothetical protein
MARSIAQIHKGMLDDIKADTVLSLLLTSTSLYAIYRNFTYIVAVAISIFEGFFDIHRTEIDDKILNQKSGRLSWYRTMALAFQFGFDLVPDKDYFDNGTATAEQIEASKIIKYAAVNEATESSRVILKIAGETAGELSPFTDPNQIEAIEYYVNEFRIAGVMVTIINYEADQLYLNIQIKRDALLLDATGMNRDGKYPVLEAIAEFMKELPFNGELRLSALVDKLQLIPGVIDATILSAQSAWINPETNGYGIPQPIFISKIAESGYFKVVNYDGIAYVV